VQIYYNGISLGVIGDFRLNYEVVTDDSQTDLLYTRVTVGCTAIVNGQAEVREVAGPPISYVDTGATDYRHPQAAADANRPAGVPPPGAVDPFSPPFVGPFPPNTDGPNRQLGAFRDVGSEAAAGGGPANFVTPAPAFASELRRVEVLAAAAGSEVTSHRLVRKRLTDPRGKLFVFNGTGGTGELLLQSPAFNRHCDCKNGPVPTHFEVVQSHGDTGGTMIVQWGCVTYTHEQKRTDAADPLLSNRFSMTHVLDEDSFLRVGVEGVAVFDAGVLHALARNPDQYRPNLLMPCPLGFVRENIKVEGLPDMTGVRYSFVDRQQHVNFPAGPFAGATRISAKHSQAVDCSDDFVEGALNAADRTLNRLWSVRAIRGR
jgi:hypothetical protein